MKRLIGVVAALAIGWAIAAPAGATPHTANDVNFVQDVAFYGSEMAQ